MDFSSLPGTRMLRAGDAVPGTMRSPLRPAGPVVIAAHRSMHFQASNYLEKCSVRRVGWLCKH
jgi:hypothetical protein